VSDRAAFAILLLLYTAALVYEASVTGITADEPSHLLSAHFYWQGHDTLAPRDMPPAIKIVGGWVPQFFNLPDPAGDAAAWATQHEWFVMNGIIKRMPGKLLGDLFFWSRLPLLIFPLLTVTLLWHWGRELFTPWTALTLAALYALEPTALGHGCLFKNDHASALGLLAFAWRASHWWRSPTWPNALYLSLAVAFAILTKLSLLVLIPLGFALLWKRPLAAFALLPIVYAITLAACQFELDRTWWMPKPYVDGVTAIVNSNATPNAVWFWGQHRPGGDWRYFLGAALVKSPLPLLALLALAAARVRSPFLWAPGLGYLALASATSLHFGFRLVLPCLPFAVLACGYAPAIARYAALPALALITALNFPLGLSYFNLIGGPPEKAWFYLADSNIDWGQDLPSLATVARRAQIQWISTYYFGNDQPRRFLAPGKFEVVAPPWSPQFAKGNVLEPAPGLYAVSANMLTGHFFAPAYRDYFRRFRERKPYAVAGGGIFLYLIEYVPPPNPPK
jgi:hypothetical protein